MDLSCTDCATDQIQNASGSVSEQIKVVSEAAEVAYDPLDATTFIPPTSLPVSSVTIEFCNRCRWLHRASWVSTELLITFAPPLLRGVHLIPLIAPETAGCFRVWLHVEPAPNDNSSSTSLSEPVLVWDRKIEGGFPELKELKQRIRDRIQPGKPLGHSDKAS